MEAEVFPKWLGKKIEMPLNSGIRQMECQLSVQFEHIKAVTLCF